MAVTALRCKECGTEYPLEALVRMRSVLRPSGGRLRPFRARGRVGQAADPGRQQRHLALRRLPAVQRSPRQRDRAGTDPARPRRSPRQAARGGGGLGQERRRQPDPQLQGPGRRRRPRQGARARLRHGRLRLDRQPRQRGRSPCRRRRAWTPTCSSRRTWRSRSCSPPTSTGPTLVGVDGNYDDVNRLCTELAAERGWAFVNVNLRPYYAEGSKTLAYETVEQLGWRLPDKIVCPIASGSLFTKIGRGFDEWRELGLVEGDLPVFHGAQAAGCGPVATAFADGQEVCRPVRPDTIAKSLAIGNPADGPYALDLARTTGGSIESVSDDEIRAGIRLLAETTGIFTETAGGVTTATLAKLAERRRARPRGPGRRLHHRRGPEDARCGARGLLDARDRADAGLVRRARPDRRAVTV